MVTRVLSRVFTRSLRTEAPASPTPILDLQQPVPKPWDEVVTGKFAMPFLVFVTMIILVDDQSFLIVPFGFLLIVFLSVMIHEVGHLAAGWCAGLKFRGVDIGPISVTRVRGVWHFRMRRRIASGFAWMDLTKIRRMRRSMIIFTLGGPVASYAFAVGAFVLGESCRVNDAIGWTTFLEFLGAYSFFLGLLSTYPYHTQTGGNDAFLLRRLIASKESAAQAITPYALYTALQSNIIPPEYYERWSRIAEKESDPYRERFYRQWRAYANSKDPSSSAKSLECLLGYCDWVGPELRNLLFAEAAYFCAWQRRDARLAEQWFKKITHLEWLGTVFAARVEIAMLSVRGRHDDALRKCEGIVALLQESLRGPISRKTEATWVEWRDQIKRSVEEAAATTESLCVNSLV